MSPTTKKHTSLWSISALVLVVFVASHQTASAAEECLEGPGEGGTSQVQKAKKAEYEPVFMFVQTAKRGSFRTAAGSPTVLTLEGVGAETVFFSDRPARIAGSIENSKFLESLGFTASNPPNAAVVLSTPDSASQDVIVAQLLNPKYDAAAQTLSYEVVILKNYDGSGLAFWTDRSDASLPAKFDQVSLFIDDCPDGQVMCYGIYQCTGTKCCRVGCGSVGQTVGYCWSWGSLSCNPCRDYTYKCSEPGAPCNNNPPFCMRNKCSTGRACT